MVVSHNVWASRCHVVFESSYWLWLQFPSLTCHRIAIYCNIHNCNFVRKTNFQRLWCSRLFLSIAPSLDSHAISAYRTLSFIMLLTSWRVLPTCGLPLRCRSAWITRMSSKSSKVTHSVVPDSKPFKLAVVVIDNSSEGVLTCRGCLTASFLHRKVFSNFPTYEALIWVSTSHLGF